MSDVGVCYEDSPLFLPLPLQPLSSADRVCVTCVKRVAAVALCTFVWCGDRGGGGGAASLSGLQPRQPESASSRGLSGRAELLLVPQDGVLVVELQVLHGGARGLLPAAVPVLNHLERLLHFFISATNRKHMRDAQLFVAPTAAAAASNPLARLHVLRRGRQRGELGVAEDLWGALGGAPFVGGQPGSRRSVHAGRLGFRRLHFFN